MGVENTENFKQGKIWEAEAIKLIQSLGLKVTDNSDNFLEPDLIVENKFGRTVSVECKKFNHKKYNVHKLTVNHFCKYILRSHQRSDIVYFYWHPEGKHEVYFIEKIADLITNFKDPQSWRDQFFYHFPRSTGTNWKFFFSKFRDNSMLLFEERICSSAG